VLKKKYVITAFVAFCLTATLFIGVTTSGNQSGIVNTTNYGTTSTGEYDPWVDLDGDGVVDSTDLGMLGVAWGSTGDPTRNVTVTNAYYTAQKWFVNITELGYQGSFWMPTAGYSHVSVYIIVFYMEAYIDVLFGIEQTHFSVDTFTMEYDTTTETVHIMYDVVGEQIGISVSNLGLTGTSAGEIAIFMYVTA